MWREELVADLKRLSKRELAQTLKTLLPVERERVLDALREAKKSPEKALPFAALVGLSPWLLAAAGRAAGEPNQEGLQMTAASRSALARVLESLGREEAALESRPAPARKGPLRAMFARKAGTAS